MNSNDWHEINIPIEYSEDIDGAKKLFVTKFPQYNENQISLLRRSIDARGKTPYFVFRFGIKRSNSVGFLKSKETINLCSNKSILIIGAGPSGFFAALQLLKMGIKPIIVERGKDVRGRRRDLKAIMQNGVVNPDSNYCFGEGGAGTYSDGKLYTRATKRGNVFQILETLFFHGAPASILYDANPHIGTNKLPQIIQSIRENIINLGGEIHFNKRMTDFEIKDNDFKFAIFQDGDIIKANGCILATGHSARDIYELFYSKKLAIEAKPLAIGVRVEHPQELINYIQYKGHFDKGLLPPASYSVVTQVRKKGVFSFCMCPGGMIVPSATSQEELVVNGMSPSKRDSKYANSGIVVTIDLDDTHSKNNNPLALLEYQKKLEHHFHSQIENTQIAPAQRLKDFVQGSESKNLPSTSYVPGVYSASMHQLLPDSIGNRLRDGFKYFGQLMKGYLTNDAIIVGLESRTSSPVRIPRDKEKLSHPSVKNLFPCGEGAGYAGGIVSAAIDGVNVAEQAGSLILKK